VGDEDEVAVYLSDYPINHRPKSVIFSKQRLAHVKRLLGSALLPDLTQDRICGYVEARLAEGAGGRTINMEVSVGFRFAYGLLEVSKWIPHSAARFDGL
jgi:hypothetical protein